MILRVEVETKLQNLRTTVTLFIILHKAVIFGKVQEETFDRFKFRQTKECQNSQYDSILSPVKKLFLKRTYPDVR